MPKRGKPPLAISGKAAAPNADSGGAYSAALKLGFKATTKRVQQMHHAIADKAFDALARVPGVSGPSELVRVAHDAITDGVYAAVRGGGHAVLSLTGAAERLTGDPNKMPQGAELQVRSALNAVVGDALAGSGSPLAVRMLLYGLTSASSIEPLTEGAIAALGQRVCLFIHGLACNEQNWLSRGEAWDTSAWDTSTWDTSTRHASEAACDTPLEARHYGAMLARDLGIDAIYLRYNTGLAIDQNGGQLAAQLEALASAAPQVRDWVLIGHSMGGLVARSACDQAEAIGCTWLQHSSMLICLGTPHQGAVLEKLGHLVSGGLGFSRVTQPLAGIADARSRGIKDLRHGREVEDDARQPEHRGPPLRFIAGSLGDAEGKAFDRVLDHLLGDGLVRQGSATDDGLAGDIERVSLAGLGHMALLNHPRVYDVVRRWLSSRAT